MTEAIESQLEAGRQARADGRMMDARNAFARATALSRESGAPSLQVLGLRHLAEIDLGARRPEAALAHADQAAALYRAHGDSDPLDLAMVLKLAALALDELRRSPEAADRWNAARDLYQAAGDAQAAAECDGQPEGRGQ
ncbi:hypothetical protein [uncultured Brevundimonas sp.]|uniref:hypothetical protein n=1 Tax=uncultured Brevundimonas sp. TaxID=213418 RepID=UPI0030ED9218|tara:strand:+ start:1122 stop:1538 length:417 start_codon:yes stop_codon:yes gene_type:complete